MVVDRQLADDIFAAWKAELARTRWLGEPPPDHDHTIRVLLDEYMKVVTPRKSVDSQRRDFGVLKRFSEQWGDLKLFELDAKLIEGFMGERLEEVSYPTISKELGLLKSAYNRAIQWGWATQNPFRGLTLHQQGNDRIRWLTDQEEIRLLKACPPWLRDIVVVGVDTGLRRRNLVELHPSWVHDGGILLIIPKENVKTQKLTVTIPLTRRTRGIVIRRLRHSHGARLFVQGDGSPYNLDKVSKAFTRAARAAGFDDVCLYTLRHTFISRLVQGGRPLAEVAALAGHRDIRMTMRYVHLAPQHLRDAIRTLEAGTRGRSSGLSPRRLSRTA